MSNSQTKATNSYSQSLFELAKENSVLDEIEVQAKSLYSVIKDSQDFSTFIKDPTFKQDKQLEIFSAIFEKVKLNSLFIKFIKFLIYKRRIFFLKNILNDFITYCSIQRGEVRAELVSSKKLDNSQIEKIKEEMTKDFNSKINLNYIQSRPSKMDKWNYSFFLDFEGHADTLKIKNLLSKLEKSSNSLKLLGSYPKAL